MRVNRLTTLGAGMMLASLAVLATLFGYGVAPASAGDPTPEFTPTVCAEEQITALAPVACPTETVVIIKTHTPTSTPTPANTSTPAPTETSAPATNTPIPPTQTPSGGNEGAGVRPPNTGSGDGTDVGSNSIWAIVLGGGLMAAGAGSLVVGARRR